MGAGGKECAVDADCASVNERCLAWTDGKQRCQTAEPVSGNSWRIAFDYTRNSWVGEGGLEWRFLGGQISSEVLGMYVKPNAGGAWADTGIKIGQQTVCQHVASCP